eukprot:scaffold83934_cov14-Prasinocladus_malaysianus.AAC.1
MLTSHMSGKEIEFLWYSMNQSIPVGVKLADFVVINYFFEDIEPAGDEWKGGSGLAARLAKSSGEESAKAMSGCSHPVRTRGSLTSSLAAKPAQTHAAAAGQSGLPEASRPATQPRTAAVARQGVAPMQSTSRGRQLRAAMAAEES